MNGGQCQQKNCTIKWQRTRQKHKKSDGNNIQKHASALPEYENKNYTIIIHNDEEYLAHSTTDRRLIIIINK